MFSKDQEPYTIGPYGERLTVADLPDGNEQRWVPRRKARVVAAVAGGLMTRDMALERYRLTPEEFDGWQTALARFGLRGLHTRSKGGRRRANGFGRVIEGNCKLARKRLGGSDTRDPSSCTWS